MRLINIVITISLFICTASFAYEIEKEPLTLQDCISIALKNNSDIRLSEYSILDARAKMDAAFTQFLPKISGKASYLKYDEVPTMDVSGFGTVPLGTEESVDLSIGLTQPIFTGGRIKNNYSINKSLYDIAQKEGEVKKKDVLKEVTQNYFQALKLKKLEEIARSSSELISSHLKNVEDFYEVGIVSKNDLLSAKVSLANADNLLIRATNGYELAKSRLNFSLNRDVNAPLFLQDVDENIETYDMALDECIDTAFLNREELGIINSTKKINESLISMEKSAHYPQLYFIGNYNATGDEFPLSDSYYSALFTLEIDIFSWGETSYNVESSKIALKKTYENETIIKNSIRFEVKASYLQLRQAQDEINATKQAVEQAEENYRIYEEKFKVNAATSTDVLDAENLVLSSKINYFQALYNFHIAKINLLRAMGDINY
jgi:outer membrane protein TolC